MGMFFAAGWSPCIGATLGAILTLGFSSDTVGQAMLLSLGYSIGLGIPFLILALLVNQAVPLVRKLGKHLKTFQIISGMLIIVIGVLMITSQMTVIARWALQSGFYLDFQSGTGVPSIITALSCRSIIIFFTMCFPISTCVFGIFKRAYD